MLFSSEVSFNYPFHQVAVGLWQKYPNPLAPHVVSTDVISRTLTEDGVLRTERIIGVRQSAPKWVTFLVGDGIQDTFVREVIFHSPSMPCPPPSIPGLAKQPCILMCSSNLTYKQFLHCRETILYSPSLSASETNFFQRADIQSQIGGSGSMIGSKVENWGKERFEKNAKVGVRGFEGVLEKVRVEFVSLKRKLEEEVALRPAVIEEIISLPSELSAPLPQQSSIPSIASPTSSNELVEPIKPRRTWISLVYPSRPKSIPSSSSPEDRVSPAPSNSFSFILKPPKLPSISLTWGSLNPLKLMPARSKPSVSIVDELVEEFEHKVEEVAREVASV